MDEIIDGVVPAPVEETEEVVMADAATEDAGVEAQAADDTVVAEEVAAEESEEAAA